MCGNQPGQYGIWARKHRAAASPGPMPMESIPRCHPLPFLPSAVGTEHRMESESRMMRSSLDINAEGQEGPPKAVLSPGLHSHPRCVRVCILVLVPMLLLFLCPPWRGRTQEKPRSPYLLDRTGEVPTPGAWLDSGDRW